MPYGTASHVGQGQPFKLAIGVQGAVMSDDELRIASGEDNSTPRDLENANSAAYTWTKSLREELVKAVVDKEQSFGDLWDQLMQKYPLPIEVKESGITELETKMHLEYIWQEIRRRMGGEGNGQKK
tara:strand:+ start:1110 stop:1487 length:378 start_codon:yes stop_codon:yes gene_type:complete